jgi:hypothetical protein
MFAGGWGRQNNLIRIELDDLRVLIEESKNWKWKQRRTKVTKMGY